MSSIIIINIGNELLNGLVENSNAGYLARRIAEHSMIVRAVYTIPDCEESIKKTLKASLEDVDIVIITGGLGPTDDDLTRTAVADYFDLPLKLNSSYLQKIEKLFSDRGQIMTVNNRKQAMVIENSRLLENDYGTAPGMLIEKEGKTIILLPGPPDELCNMFEKSVIPYLNKKRTGELKLIKTLKCIGIGESKLEMMIKDGVDWPYEPLSFIAKGGEVYLQLKASGEKDQAEHILLAGEKKIKTIVGDNIYGCDEDTLSNTVVKLLLENNKTVACAESCTGGLLSDYITDVPGCSRVYRGSIVAYSAEAKSRLLGIDKGTLATYGLVSEETARAMALSVRELFAADYGIGITGLAGPDSDDLQLPVGLVYLVLDDGVRTISKKLMLPGNRRMVKERAVQACLAAFFRLLKSKGS